MAFFPQRTMERPLMEMDAPTVIITRMRISLDLACRMGPLSNTKPMRDTEKRVRKKASAIGSFREAVIGDHEHPAQHHKLSLGKIDDPRGVVDEGEADGNQGIGASRGQARKE